MRYIIYTNENGTDRYVLEGEEHPEDKYRELLEEHGDTYDWTSAVFIEIYREEIVDVWSVFLPEYD